MNKLRQTCGRLGVLVLIGASLGCGRLQCIAQESAAETQAPAPDKSYRDDARHFTFTAPASWKELYSDDNTFVFEDGEAKYIVYFGSFSDLFYLVGGSGSPWNIKMGGHDEFTATAGDFYMEASGNNGSSSGPYTTVLVTPVMELMRVRPVYRALYERFQWDPAPASATAASNTGVSSAASQDRGGCPGCASMIMDHMDAMTAITGSGW